MAKRKIRTLVPEYLVPKRVRVKRLKSTAIKLSLNENIKLYIPDGIPLLADKMSCLTPLVSLATQPDMKVREFSDDKGHHCIVRPSDQGHATIFMFDTIIYVISGVAHLVRQGVQFKYNSSQYVQFSLNNLKKTCGDKSVCGDDYNAYVNKVLMVLKGVGIKTNFATGRHIRKREGFTPEAIFGFIEDAIVWRDNVTQEIESIEIKLPNVLWNAAISPVDVIELDPLYFRLRNPTHKSLYLYAHVMCYRAGRHHIQLADLQEAIGSRSSLKQFRSDIRKMIAAKKNLILGYGLHLDNDRDEVIIFNNKLIDAPEGMLAALGKIPTEEQLMIQAPHQETEGDDGITDAEFAEIAGSPPPPEEMF
jgi:hypothetical protein